MNNNRSDAPTFNGPKGPVSDGPLETAPVTAAACRAAARARDGMRHCCRDRVAGYPMTTTIAQCGRTFRHPAHHTTEGLCAGLDGTEVRPIPGLLRRLYNATRGM